MYFKDLSRKQLQYIVRLRKLTFNLNDLLFILGFKEFKATLKIYVKKKIIMIHIFDQNGYFLIGKVKIS